MEARKTPLTQAEENLAGVERMHQMLRTRTEVTAETPAWLDTAHALMVELLATIKQEEIKNEMFQVHLALTDIKGDIQEEQAHPHVGHQLLLYEMMSGQLKVTEFYFNYLEELNSKNKREILEGPRCSHCDCPVSLMAYGPCCRSRLEEQTHFATRGV
jgi:hypothetical protein